MPSPSILIVDDIKKNVVALRNFFEVEPYRYKVLTAATVEEALAHAQREVIHVAVIDIRLKEQRNDVSGLLLAKQLPSFMGKVIVTGMFFQNPTALVTTVLGGEEEDINADAFVWATEGAKGLAKKVVGTLRRIRLNLDLKITWERPLGWGMLVNQLKTFRDSDAVEKAKAEEVLQDLTCKLFDSAEALHFLRVMPGHSKCVVAMARAVMDGSKGQPWALKFGPRDVINQEVNNYKSFVNEFIGVRSTQLRVGPGGKHNEEVYAVYSREMAAIAYKYIGKDGDMSTRDLAYHYRKTDARKFCATLDHLFNETCRSWYEERRHPRPKEAQPLDEYYRRQLNLWEPERVKELGQKFEQLAKADLPGLSLKPDGPDAFEVKVEERPGLSLPNPVSFALKQKSREGGSDFFPPPSLVAITHGDLHSGNVLVSERGLTWLIDFYKTGRGPALRDFAEMECDIKFDRMETNSLRARYDLEEALLAPTSLAPRELLSAATSLPAPAARALVVIQHLRLLAAQHIEVEGMREYLIALLFYALKRIEGFTSASAAGESGSPAQYHALLSAALICHKLTLLGASGKGVVFLAHPYRTPWDKRFRKGFKDFLTGRGYHVLHPLDEQKTGQLWLRVAEMLRSSTTAFCEVSSVNGNVLFELGYVMGLRKPYLILFDQRQGGDGSALPLLLTGEMRLDYRTKEVLHRGALGALEGNRDDHGKYFYEDADFKRRARQGHKPRPGSALLLTANTRHQRQVVAPHLRLVLKDEGWRVDTIELEGEMNVGDFYLRASQFELVVGCFAAARDAEITRANAELALALGIRCGTGRELIVLQHKRGVVLSDTTVLTKTFERLDDAAEVLRAELKRRFPHRRRRAKKG